MPDRPRLTPAVADVRRAVREAWERVGVNPGQLVLVACSGGADSLALAAAAAFEGKRSQVRVGAVIVEHGLQAETAAVANRTAATLEGGGGPIGHGGGFCLQPVLHNHRTHSHLGTLALEGRRRRERQRVRAARAGHEYQLARVYPNSLPGLTYRAAHIGHGGGESWSIWQNPLAFGLGVFGSLVSVFNSIS